MESNIKENEIKSPKVYFKDCDDIQIERPISRKIKKANTSAFSPKKSLLHFK